MARRAEQAFMVTDEQGTQHRFAAGEDVPDELAARVDNTAVWEKSDVPLDDGSENVGLVNASEPVMPSGVADAPYAEPAPEGEGVVTPPSGIPGSLPSRSDDTDSELSEQSADAGTAPSPEELDKMTRAELDEVAASRGLSTSGMSKADVKAAISEDLGRADRS